MKKRKIISVLSLLCLLSSCSFEDNSTSSATSSSSTTSSVSTSTSSSSTSSTSSSSSSSSSSSPVDTTKVVTLKKRVDDKFIDITTERVTSGNKLTYSTTPTIDKKEVTDSDGLTSTSVYTFKQWVTLPSGKTEADWDSLSESDFITFDIANTVITDNITVYATFDVANTYQVAFYNADGTTLLQEATNVVDGNSVTFTKSTPTYTDNKGVYTFAGWKTSDGTIVDISTTTISKNYKLIANFNCSAYPVVTIVDQNNNVVYKKSIAPTSNTISSSTLEEEMQNNYWNDEENKEVHYFTLTDVPSEDTTISSDTTYHATVTTISYDKNGIWPQTKVTDTTLQANIDTALSSSTYTLGSNTYAVVDNKYYSKEGTTYRKVEPIKWIILDGDFTSGATLLSEKALTSRKFYNYGSAATGDTRTIDGANIYHNNYKYSEIRAWLNGLTTDTDTDTFGEDFEDYNFISIVFKDSSLLQTTIVDNSLDSVKTGASSVTNDYVCENTNDRVWLLSEKEVFSDGTDRTYTPYECFGIYKQNDTSVGGSLSKRKAYDVDGNAVKWYLRSPVQYSSPYCQYIRTVYVDGSSGVSAAKDDYGIRPAVRFKL